MLVMIVKCNRQGRLLLWLLRPRRHRSFSPNEECHAGMKHGVPCMHADSFSTGAISPGKTESLYRMRLLGQQPASCRSASPIDVALSITCQAVSATTTCT